MLLEEDSIMMSDWTYPINVKLISIYDGYTFLAPECCSHATYDIAFPPKESKIHSDLNPTQTFFVPNYRIPNSIWEQAPLSAPDN